MHEGGGFRGSRSAAGVDERGLPLPRTGTGPVALGDAVPRIDAWAKVTGAARYTAEHSAAGMLQGVVVNAPVTRARIAVLDVTAAQAVPASRCWT